MKWVLFHNRELCVASSLLNVFFPLSWVSPAYKNLQSHSLHTTHRLTHHQKLNFFLRCILRCYCCCFKLPPTDTTIRKRRLQTIKRKYLATTHPEKNSRCWGASRAPGRLPTQCLPKVCASVCPCLSLLHLPTSFPSGSRRAAASSRLSTLRSFKQPRRQQQPWTQQPSSSLAPRGSPGFLSWQAEGTASALWPPCGRARGAPLPEPGPREGAQAAGRQRAAPPLRTREAAGPGVPARPGPGEGLGGRSHPCASCLLRAAARSLREGAGWARGGGRGMRRGRRRSQSERRPAPPHTAPRPRRLLPLSSSSSHPDL